MDEAGGGQLHSVAHESVVHAALLMDVLRIVRQIDPEAFQRQVDEVERELHDACADPKSGMQGPTSRSVLEHRLVFLRSVQIQATVGYQRDLMAAVTP